VALVLLTLGVLLAISVRDYFTVSETRLPDLVGMRYEEAARVLRSSRLEPVTYVENVGGVAADTVTSQAPLPGTVVKRGRTISLGVNTPAAEAKVPRFIDMSQPRALERATELQMPVGRVDYAADASAAGTVVGQDPAPEARLGPGQSVTLVVSRGPERAPVALPDLRGVDLQAAVQQLRDLGFREVETAPSTVSFDRAGAVTGMHPVAGTEVVPSTPVALFYALSARNVVQVPSVGGMPLWRAQLALQAAQLVVGHVTYVQQADALPGVLEAAPSGYTVPGTPIQLTVNGTPSSTPLPRFQSTPGAGAPAVGNASGAAGGTRSVPFTFDPAGMGVKRLMQQPFQLKLVVQDDRGERTVLDRNLKAGESVSTTVQVYGSGVRLLTYIDGDLFQAWTP